MNVAELLYEDPRTHAPAAPRGRISAHVSDFALRAVRQLVGLEQPSTWKGAVEKRLGALASYQRGWDGYNSPPPRHSVLRFASSILESTMRASTPPPSIVPLCGGGVQLEWHTGGYDIELAIYAPYQAELSVESEVEDDAVDDLALSTNFAALGKALGALTD